MYQKKQERKCANPKCNNLFVPYSEKNIYCSKECYVRKKEKHSEDTIFICPECRESTNIGFNPRKCEKKWSKFECKCGYRVKSDYEEIMKIKRMFKEEDEMEELTKESDMV